MNYRRVPVIINVVSSKRHSTVGTNTRRYIQMMTPDDSGRLWHRGTWLGLYYAIAMAVVLLITGIVPKEIPTLSWLEKLQFLVLLAPIAAASKAYVIGRRDARSSAS